MDLYGITFKIPHYQRGYKWTKVEIERLLGDIKEFMDKDGNNGATRYFIQPIMVKKDKKENTYTLVDGQQRLTTIYMIMKALGEKPGYHLEYEKYEGNGGYEKLEDILSKIRSKNYNNADTPDEYYICQGYKTIDNWLESNKLKNDALYRKKFADTIKCKVYVVWYELGEKENEREVFIRINSGKIPLTDSELIRGLLLQKKNFDNNEINRMLYSERWDKIQMRLEEDDFWYFLSGKSGNDYETRMDFVFEVIAGRKKDERYSIYQEVKENLEKEKIEKFWKNVEKVFSYMEYLYRNDEMYHYFGFLTSTNKEVGRNLLSQITSIKKNNKNNNKNNQDQVCENKSSKSEILDCLKSEIKNQLQSRMSDTKKNNIKAFIDGLIYGNNDADIKFILLLFNVITAIKTPGYRFPFDIYNRSEWSLEHIHPREFEGLGKNKDLVKWLCEEYKGITEDNTDIKECIEYAIQVVGRKIEESGKKQKENKEPKSNGEENNTIQECLKLVKDKEISKPPNCEIEESMDPKKIGEIILKKLNEYYSASTESSDINGIGNLALLQKDLNSSLQNRSFKVKRGKILNWYKKGEHFIPPATLNAFLKAYTEDPNTLHVWHTKDMEDYKKAIIEAIKEKLLKEVKNEQ